MNPSTTQPKPSLSVLPQEIQDIFTDGRITLTNICLREHYVLTVERLNAFEAELGITLLGLEFISDFQTRAKQALQATDETVLDVLDDVAALVLTPDIMAILSAMEQAAQSQESSPAKQPIPPVTIKQPPAAEKKVPEAKPGIVANPQEKAVPQGNVATIKQSGNTQVPTGKMVGLKKEATESTIKGMRTMRGDISKLRGPESETAGEIDKSDSLQKPFNGK